MAEVARYQLQVTSQPIQLGPAVVAESVETTPGYSGRLGQPRNDRGEALT